MLTIKKIYSTSIDKIDRIVKNDKLSPIEKRNQAVKLYVKSKQLDSTEIELVNQSNFDQIMIENEFDLAYQKLSTSSLLSGYLYEVGLSSIVLDYIGDRRFYTCKNKTINICDFNDGKVLKSFNMEKVTELNYYQNKLLILIQGRENDLYYFDLVKFDQPVKVTNIGFIYCYHKGIYYFRHSDDMIHVFDSTNLKSTNTKISTVLDRISVNDNYIVTWESGSSYDSKFNIYLLSNYKLISRITIKNKDCRLIGIYNNLVYISDVNNDDLDEYVIGSIRVYDIKFSLIKVIKLNVIIEPSCPILIYKGYFYTIVREDGGCILSSFNMDSFEPIGFKVKFNKVFLIEDIRDDIIVLKWDFIHFIEYMMVEIGTDTIRKLNCDNLTF